MQEIVEYTKEELKKVIAQYGKGSPEHVEVSKRLFNICSLVTGDISSPSAVQF